MNYLRVLVGLFCLAIIKADQQKNDIIDAINNFSIDLFKNIAAIKKDPNLIISPLSVHEVLSMATYGAANETYEQMRSKLYLPSSFTDAEKGYNEVQTELNNVTDLKLTLSNQMYLDKSVLVEQTYIDIMDSMFHSKPSLLDMNNPTESAQKVNDWVKNATHEMINEMIKEDDITVNTRMLLLNAVYFEGSWDCPFNKYNTKKKLFFNRNSSKNVDMMKVNGFYNWANLTDLGVQFIEIPYVNKEVKMTIIVPHEGQSLDAIIQNQEFFNLSLYKNNGEVEELILEMPKFKIESSFDLVDALKNLGMDDMFSDTADFSKMSNNTSLNVEKISQKAAIEVDENGSKASASTTIFFGIRSMSPDIVFQVDRPSLFFITVKNIFVFIGRIGDP